MNKREIYEHITGLIAPILADKSMELVELKISNSKDGMHIMAFIYKADGITLDDITMVSRELSEELDREDKIEAAYFLEISSPGLDRPIKTQDDFRRNMGKYVEAKLYKAIDGNKSIRGTIKDYDNEYIVLDVEGKDVSIEIETISQMKQYVIF